jgi:predicted methyltransferase
MLSNGNINIYQYLNNDDLILRQIIPGQSEFCQLINKTAISIKVFVSTLHQINVKYGVKVDNNAIKILSNGEPLLGISERIWTFYSCM